MDTIVLKFGGSSIADNEKLQLVANRITKLYDKGNKIVVILSAQGKTTDKLIEEAKELSPTINNRELDSLLSSGEQVSISKLGILLNSMGYQAISLNGWQAGIYTDNTNQNAIIKRIDTTRIIQELNDDKIVIIAGFQGINENMDITTLGRGGSDRPLHHQALHDYGGAAQHGRGGAAGRGGGPLCHRRGGGYPLGHRHSGLPAGRHFQHCPQRRYRRHQ